MKTKKQAIDIKERKRLTRRQKMQKSGSGPTKSNYAKKQEHLHNHGGLALDYKDKPWK